MVNFLKVAHFMSVSNDIFSKLDREQRGFRQHLHHEKRVLNRNHAVKNGISDKRRGAENAERRGGESDKHWKMWEFINQLNSARLCVRFSRLLFSVASSDARQFFFFELS